MSSNNDNLPSNISNYVNTNIKSLLDYAKTLSQYKDITESQKEIFLSLAKNLESINIKWQNGIGKCLIRSDLAVLYNFGDLLARSSINRYFVHDSIYDRLAKFWLHIKDIPDSRAAEIIGQDISKNSSNGLNLEKIYAARENTKLMIDSVIERNYSTEILQILDIPTVLLTIMIRSEAHEYALEKILEATKSIIDAQIDIANLLSVDRKEPKGERKFKPDTRAIRDATAHAKFKIYKESGDLVIDFNNTDQGYRFQRRYSRKELLHFYQDYDRLTNNHVQLLTIRLLYAFLNMNFVSIN